MRIAGMPVWRFAARVVVPSLAMLSLAAWEISGRINWYVQRVDSAHDTSLYITRGCVILVHQPYGLFSPSYATGSSPPSPPTKAQWRAVSPEFNARRFVLTPHFRGSLACAQVVLPVWVLSLPFVLATPFAWYLTRTNELGHCRCGYCLDGLARGRCPECGREIASQRCCPHAYARASERVFR